MNIVSYLLRGGFERTEKGVGQRTDVVVYLCPIPTSETKNHLPDNRIFFYFFEVNIFKPALFNKASTGTDKLQCLAFLLIVQVLYMI